MIRAITDALCWVMQHDNLNFEKNGREVDALLREKGIVALDFGRAVEASKKPSG